MTKGPFKKIDEFIFRQVDVIKANALTSNILSQLDQLPDIHQKIINQSLSFALALFPLVFVGIFAWSNHSLKNEIELKENILTAMTRYLEKNSDLSRISRTMLGPTAFESSQDLEKRLQAAANSQSINPTDLSVQNFEIQSSESEYTKISASFRFQNLSTKELSSLLSVMINQDKIKIEKMNVTKNIEKSTISGTIDLVHMGRVVK